MTDDIFLLDTNVISNSSKTSPLPAVKQWLDRQARLAIPFAVILEVETGIAELWPVDPVRARKLTEWIDGLLKTRFYYPPSTPEVARVLAKLYCCKPLHKLWYPQEDKKPGQDLFIAAVSIVYDMPIATMNHGDFEQINKFQALPGVYNPNRQAWAVPRSKKTSTVGQSADALPSRNAQNSTSSQDQCRRNNSDALGALAPR
ncbi:PIN domain-containing protein [Rhizobium ruizarguesonis]|uniref:PIN domain-containing protein n=1 Tax=Rhizobium ruizarguesonis TaxID=2081791 RepID=UPI00102FD4FE|nr:PIN domain-containing protein [Rhizobium ruizarguesonis]TAT96066.1 type II toxin-antitoxin system VapC family toxin [Rhizobium ruizarguesonis]